MQELVDSNNTATSATITSTINSLRATNWPHHFKEQGGQGGGVYEVAGRVGGLDGVVSMECGTCVPMATSRLVRAS
eukprot:scaffold6849_cov157-Skeletonema_marinoi.AAC.15